MVTAGPGTRRRDEEERIILMKCKDRRAEKMSEFVTNMFQYNVTEGITRSEVIFPECVARVPVSLGGLGVRLCSPSFAFSVATVRNRRQVFATACGDAVRLSTVASVSGVVPKACQVESWRRSYIGVCRGGVCESDLWRRSYIGVCRGGVCDSDLCRRSYIGGSRGGV